MIIWYLVGVWLVVAVIVSIGLGRVIAQDERTVRNQPADPGPKKAA